MEINEMMQLEAAINKAIKDNKSIGVLIEMPGFEEPELIINPCKNLKQKLRYYKDTYDENLNHKKAPGIKIVGYTS